MQQAEARAAAERAAPAASSHVLEARLMLRPGVPRLDLLSAALRAGRGARRRRCAGGSSRGSPGARRRSSRRPAPGSRATHARDHLAHAVLDEARAAMGLFDHLDLIGALHQLVDLRGHARLRDLSSAVASISATHSSMQPICSVARPRWLCVATGHALRGCARSAPPRTRPRASRSRARSATSSCAHGHAVMPVAETPTMRRVPCSKATARPCSV